MSSISEPEQPLKSQLVYNIIIDKVVFYSLKLSMNNKHHSSNQNKYHWTIREWSWRPLEILSCQHHMQWPIICSKHTVIQLRHKSPKSTINWSHTSSHLHNHMDTLYTQASRKCRGGKQKMGWNVPVKTPEWKAMRRYRNMFPPNDRDTTGQVESHTSE